MLTDETGYSLIFEVQNVMQEMSCKNSKHGIKACTICILHFPPGLLSRNTSTELARYGTIAIKLIQKLLVQA